MQDQMQPDMNPEQNNTMPPGETDQEGAMAKADLYKLANYSFKLFKKLGDDDQLEAWVQAKITKAADYIASVYHYLEYEMEFSEYAHKLENAEMVSEEAKAVLKNKLMEARQKVAELKKAQVEKIKGKKVEEGILSGGERPCTECGGTGMVYEEPKEVPDHVKTKVDKYKRLVKATKAAHKRMDANNNGIPDDEEMEEDQGDLKKTGDTYKTHKGGTVTKTATGVKHERDPESYDDGGDETDTMAKSGKGTKSHAKSQSAAEKKDRAPAQKKSKSGTWGMEGGEKFDNRKKEKEVDETYGQGVYEGKKKGDGNLANNAKPYDKITRGDVVAGRLGKDEMGGKKKVKEELKGNQKKLDVDNDDDIEADDLADLRAGKKAKEVKEGSTGDYSAKKAAAGKDIGKPGKNFAKIAKKAGGGEKGEKIAGAVLKNLRKESVEPQVEVIAESAEVARIKELTQKLLG